METKWGPAKETPVPVVAGRRVAQQGDRRERFFLGRGAGLRPFQLRGGELVHGGEERRRGGRVIRG